MKKLTYLIVFISINVFSQTKYLTKTGIINFEASVPSVEEVKAENKSVTAIVNTGNGEFAALVFVKGFRFKNALMEEHFNENYAESDSYPKATFKGQILDLDLSNIKNQESSFVLKGALTFHGKTKQLNDLEVLVSLQNDVITISGTFKVKASDFDIKIPKIVSGKIAEDIEVSFNFPLKKK